MPYLNSGALNTAQMYSLHMSSVSFILISGEMYMKYKISVVNFCFYLFISIHKINKGRRCQNRPLVMT